MYGYHLLNSKGFGYLPRKEAASAGNVVNEADRNPNHIKADVGLQFLLGAISSSRTCGLELEGILSLQLPEPFQQFLESWTVHWITGFDQFVGGNVSLS